MTSISARYRVRADAFEAKVARVKSDAWANPSPCAQWTALEVVDHVIDMHGVMLGHPIPRTEDPLTDFREARRQVQEALDSDRARGEVSTPAGPMTMERFRTPGAFGPGIEVYGAEIPVPDDAPLQDRLLGYVGRNPMSKSP